MNKNNWVNSKLTPGKGMVLGVLFSAAIALIVHIITGDAFVWSWATPVGLATGLAIGAGRAAEENATTKDPS